MRKFNRGPFGIASMSKWMGLAMLLIATEGMADSPQDDGIRDFTNFIKAASDRYQVQQSTLADRRDDITDSEDRNVINRYYNQLKHSYLLAPLNEKIQSTSPEAAIQAYVNGIRSGFSGNGPEDEALYEDLKVLRTQHLIRKSEGKDSPWTSEDEANYTRIQNNEKLGTIRACLRDKLNFSMIGEARETFSNSMGSMKDLFYQPYNIRNADTSQYSNSGEVVKHAKRIENSLKYLADLKLEESVDDCCIAKQIKGNGCQKFLTEAKSLKKSFRDSFKSPMPVSFMKSPNPLEVNNLSAQDFVTIITEKEATLKALRSNHAKNDEYYDEQDVFESMARCRIKAKRYQTRREPLSKKAINALGQTIKCGLLPLWGSGLDTQWQRMTTAVGSAPIQGGGFDFSCNPQEMEAWNAIVDQSRDPANWGLPQLANPPYIDSLRRMPPVVTGLPSANMSADDWLYMNPAPGLDDFDSVSRSRIGVNPVNAQGGPRANTRNVSRSIMKTSSSGYAMVSGESRGVTQGKALSKAVRQSSSDIRKGQNAQLSATRMRSGASNTRRFIAKGLDRTRSKTPAARIAAQTSSARNVSRVVLRASGTSASRSTGQGLLGDLSRMNQNNNGLGDIGDVGAQNRQVRDDVKKTIQARLNNIELARGKSESSQMGILQLIAKYDGIIADTTISIRGKAAKKIAEIMKSTQAQLVDITRQLGVKKMEYDTYQAAILSENSALSRLATFGPSNYSFIAPGQSGSGRGTASSSGARSPATDAVNAGSMPSGLAGGGRGSVTLKSWNDEDSAWDKLLHFMSPVENAWAKTFKNDQEYEAFWAQEWRRFNREFEGYVIGQAEQENLIAVEASKLIAARNSKITEETYDNIDHDTMVTMDIFLDELEGETDFLIEGHKQNDFKLTGAVLDTVMKASVDAKASRQLLDEYQIEKFNSLPKSYEEDPSIWYGLLPAVLLQN